MRAVAGYVKWTLPLALLIGMGSSSASKVESADPPVDFDLSIRPILSDKCYKCHGPDDAQRQADLRLDTQAALKEASGSVIMPGNAAQSELMRRLLADDENRMPPQEAKNDLTAAEVELIRRWIDEGATWKPHWAFVAPVRAPLPEVPDPSWTRNAVDRFISLRLQHAGSHPSPEASKEVLLRRVTLDLTGVGPTPQEVADFLADDSPLAYERVVDRLLASPKFGERLALDWLYAARYADTSGYQNDGPRHMWRWRDWVIDAYNRGMPFNDFSIAQLAGDLLPNATFEQRLATGFNRNHRGNSEGGVIPEEYQVEYVVDRVETTSTVWMGLTFGCARCHDHKFDPLTQREFYQMYAFFNNIPENGRAIKEGNSPPFMKAPTELQRQSLRELKERLNEVQARFVQLQPKIEQQQQAWEATLATSKHHWELQDGRIAYYPLDNLAGPAPLTFTGGAPQAIPGRVGQAITLDGKRFLEAGDVAKFGYFDPFTISVWFQPADANAGTILSRMTDIKRGDGYYLVVENGQVQVNLVKRWLDDSLRVQSLEAVAQDRWTHLVVVYDGSRVADGVHIFLNGKLTKIRPNLDGINQTFANDEPLRIGGGGGPEGRFRGRIDDVQIFDRAISVDEVGILGAVGELSELAQIPLTDRTPGQRRRLRRAFLEVAAPAPIGRTYRELVSLQNQVTELVESFPTVMVMEEMKTPRATHVLNRGQYDKPGAAVTADVPSILPGLEDAPHDRLGLARWLLDPKHPLTSRVAVNRDWQRYFGTGLVPTSEDFGIQGVRPTHPHLLDWLARELADGGWDIKQAQRRIVLSATYRQASSVSAEQLESDPENRLLARGPRFRLPAEVVRDQTLAASGLLDVRIGGPSVKPYQPPDLWKDIATDNEYIRDTGPDLYRPSMYIYWKRTVVPPAMSAFDATSREMCTVRARRTNTPLQALTLMNDVTFVEAARVLAQNVMQKVPEPADRLDLTFRQVLGRSPTEAERKVISAGWKRHQAMFRERPDDARQLTQTGDYPVNKNLDPVDLAAYTALASTLLNLDEFVTKQ